MWHLSVLKLNPMKMVVKVESSSPEQNVVGDFSVWSEDGMQKKLLQSIEEGLRGYHDLEIVGCLNEEIAMKPSQTVQSLSGPIHTLSRHIWHLSWRALQKHCAQVTLSNVQVSAPRVRPPCTAFAAALRLFAYLEVGLQLSMRV
jgi:hypothetical protein